MRRFHCRAGGPQHRIAQRAQVLVLGRRFGELVRRRERRPVIDAQPDRPVKVKSPAQRLEILGPRNGHRNITDRVFKNQIPTDDPGDELAERGVGVGISGARDGNHRCKLGIAQRRKAAGDRHQHKRNDQRRAGAQMRAITRRRRPDQGENARPNNCADAEKGKMHRTQSPLQPLFRAFCITQKSVERLGAKKRMHGFSRSVCRDDRPPPLRPMTSASAGRLSAK